MPIMGGVNACKKIKENLKAKAPQIVALTAAFATEVKEQCFSAGMTGFLLKPIQKEIFQQAMAKYLS